MNEVERSIQDLYEHIKKRDFEAAEKSLLQLEKTGVEIEAFYLNKSYLYIETEKYVEALEALNDCISKYPQSFQAYRNRGICMIHLSRFREAQANFKLAHQLRPDDRESIVDLALAYFATKDYEQTHQILLKFKKLLQGHARARGLDYELKKVGYDLIWD